MLQMHDGTKNVREQNLFQVDQNMFQIEQRMFADKICYKSKKKCYKRNTKCSWMKMVFKVTWSLLNVFLVAFHFHVWHFATLYVPCLVCLWSCMAFDGHFMAKYWFDWTCIGFSRGHRSKFILSCFSLMTRIIRTSYLAKFQERAITNLKNYSTKNDENLRKPKGGQ